VSSGVLWGGGPEGESIKTLKQLKLSAINFYRKIILIKFEDNQFYYTFPFIDRPSGALLGGSPLGIGANIFQTAITFYLSTSQATCWYQI